MKIILMGYMGSGKSTIGKVLAEKLKYNFLDLDQYIEQKSKASISEIFQQKDAIHFRKLENKALSELLQSNDDNVIALGGGTPCYANNLNLIKGTANVKSIYLNGSVKFLTERLYPERTHRPLISGIKEENDLMEFIGKHLFERSSYYMQSDITVSIENKSVENIIEEILINLF